MPFAPSEILKGLPTDNLHKWLASVGLLVLLSSVVIPATLIGNLRDELAEDRKQVIIAQSSERENNDELTIWEGRARALIFYKLDAKELDVLNKIINKAPKVKTDTPLDRSMASISCGNVCSRNAFSTTISTSKKISR